MKTYANYLYNGIPSVLLYEEDALRLCPAQEPLSTDGGFHPYELTDELAAAIEAENFLPCGNYEDSYLGGWTEATEIGYNTVRNIENDQRTVIEWTSNEYAMMDEAERELCVTTDRYYDWTSARAEMIRQIEGGYDIQELEKEWNTKCAEYESVLDSINEDYSFASIIEEANR